MSVSASTYLVETVHSSTMNDSGAMMIAESSRSPYYFYHTPESPGFQQPGSLQSPAIYQQPPPTLSSPPRPPPPSTVPGTNQPQLIATISAGFEKGDYLIREEEGSNTYFDFFEEAYNFACQKGYSRMPKHEEIDYMEVIKRAHNSVPGGCRYNTGRLLMVLRKKLVPIKVPLKEDYDEEPLGQVMAEGGILSDARSSDSSSLTRSKNKIPKKLKQITNTIPTYSELSADLSTACSSASTSYVDSWE